MRRNDGHPGPRSTSRAAAKPHRTLILGGARSGKSVTAERLLASHPRVDYVATGAPPDDTDPDWAARIRAHRNRRPATWTTLETLDVEKVLVPPRRRRRAAWTPRSWWTACPPGWPG